MMKLFRKNKKESKSLVGKKEKSSKSKDTSANAGTTTSVSTSFGTSNYSELSGDTGITSGGGEFGRGNSHRGSKLFRSIRKRFSRSKSSAINSSQTGERTGLVIVSPEKITGGTVLPTTSKDKTTSEKNNCNCSVISSSSYIPLLESTSVNSHNNISGIVRSSGAVADEYGCGCGNEVRVQKEDMTTSVSGVTGSSRIVVIEPPVVEDTDGNVDLISAVSNIANITKVSSEKLDDKIHKNSEDCSGVVEKIQEVEEEEGSSVNRRSYEMSMNRNSELTVPVPPNSGSGNKPHHHRMSYTGGNDGKKSTASEGRPVSSTAGRPVHRNVTGRRGGGKVRYWHFAKNGLISLQEYYILIDAISAKIKHSSYYYYSKRYLYGTF